MSAESSFDGSALHLRGGSVDRTVRWAAVERVLFISKHAALPTEEPDCGWAVQTADEVILVPPESGILAALERAAGDSTEAPAFFSAHYAESPVSWAALRWNWKLLKRQVGLFRPRALDTVLARARLSGPMSWTQLKTIENL
jgi:hypothetical protein